MQFRGQDNFQIIAHGGAPDPVPRQRMTFEESIFVVAFLVSANTCDCSAMAG
jgi:hypothetical protein